MAHSPKGYPGPSPSLCMVRLMEPRVMPSQALRKVHNSAITEKESGMPFLDLHPEQFLGSNSPISFAETALSIS